MWWYNRKLIQVMSPPSAGDGWTGDSKPPYCV